MKPCKREVGEGVPRLPVREVTVPNAGNRKISQGPSQICCVADHNQERTKPRIMFGPGLLHLRRLATGLVYKTLRHLSPSRRLVVYHRRQRGLNLHRRTLE